MMARLSRFFQTAGAKRGVDTNTAKRSFVSVLT
jgi:hypothetical protein